MRDIQERGRKRERERGGEGRREEEKMMEPHRARPGGSFHA